MRVNMRKARSCINSLVDDDGARHSEENKITNIITQYFGNLFSSSLDLDMSNVPDYVPCRVTEDMNVRLCSPYTCEEVEMALKQMHPHKVPGPNGMNPFFYQKF